jgi:hypothetical protein
MSSINASSALAGQQLLDEAAADLLGGQAELVEGEHLAPFPTLGLLARGGRLAVVGGVLPADGVVNDWARSAGQRKPTS